MIAFFFCWVLVVCRVGTWFCAFEMRFISGDFSRLIEFEVLMYSGILLVRNLCLSLVVLRLVILERCRRVGYLG